MLAKLLRKAATKLAVASVQPGLVIGASDLREYLGRPRFTPDAHERTSVPGVATGLAVTGLGGDVLFVEASALDGTAEGSRSGGLTLTGQLGEVMKESAQIALSYVRAHADQLDITEPDHPRSPHSHPRSRGRGAQGWPLGRSHDGDSSDLDGARQACTV